ncbi:type I-E CRISPR-associated protein Cse2/CasB [Nocardia wallacei]|uniref:Type I-E CRISPR-associated protein Cse2/CasB n=1 Tax=Nocardia wallacei TaxID=480035 RepID=A0A7G1KMF5_9NOCA|nr:type I-E CRISPR-associated protein Cse2/CasB [Nocardia wallacei]BCK56230.1 hypothetical protein NWFMUON74_40020 [Nocardia wallacei]
MTTSTRETTTVERKYRLGDLGRFLDPRLTQLQDNLLRGVPAARADLARLRRGVGKPVGDVPEIWNLTVGDMPDHVRWSRGESYPAVWDDATRTEQAAHAAMTLFAVHQQSMTVRAHKPGTTFGTAVAQLKIRKTANTEAVTRRFTALATAETVEEFLTHARGLITQLRGEGLGFDYARFADDVVALLTPGRQVTVRLAWGRDFHRTTTESTPKTTTKD